MPLRLAFYYYVVLHYWPKHKLTQTTATAATNRGIYPRSPKGRTNNIDPNTTATVANEMAKFRTGGPKSEKTGLRLLKKSGSLKRKRTRSHNRQRPSGQCLPSSTQIQESMLHVGELACLKSIKVSDSQEVSLGRLLTLAIQAISGRG